MSGTEGFAQRGEVILNRVNLEEIKGDTNEIGQKLCLISPDEPKNLKFDVDFGN